MAVSGNASAIDMTNYEAFNNKSITALSSVTIDENAVAGVTPAMASNISTALITYVDAVKTAFAGIVDAVHSATDGKTMFQGDSINNAISTFVTDVKAVAESYMVGLRGAEQEIVDAVAKAYLDNDTTVASSVQSSTDAMEGFNG